MIERDNSPLNASLLQKYDPRKIIFQDGPQKHLISPINFNKQKSRPLFVSRRTSPHEKRFDYMGSMPRVLSQVR